MTLAVDRVSDATARVLDANACVSTASTDGIRKQVFQCSGTLSGPPRLTASSGAFTPQMTQDPRVTL
ncbi:hypothetical protein Q8A67_024247 [Cirrhinus molitorella]|uniref:Uncharacterized protein n=1 Tax=Cirrhinus molitorella TaxID=172907 RepID=A0AA88TK00_9TELE|nr:hypothetical protein Q8A67_024247 [Cirrhinus molitorella]